MTPAAERIGAGPHAGTAWMMPAPAIASPFPLPVLLGLFLLYLPIYGHLADTLWLREEYAHGPLIALTSAFLLWRERTRLSILPQPRQAWPGALLFAGGLLLAWAGQTQGIALFVTTSQLPVLAGIVLTLHGMAGLRLAAFPVLFLLFMVPLPSMLVDALTLGLKEWISAITVHLLHAAGYPVARSGVIIVIGQYQMLVADACSGLHSLFSLAALGVLYDRLRPQRRWPYKSLVLAAIVPVALAANLLRTLVVVLVTYHAGDAVARAWHEAAGILLFVFALMLLSAVSAFLARHEAQRKPT